jgi:predicted ferric reductase
MAAYCVLSLSVMLGLLRSIARISSERLTWVADELHAFLATLTGLLVVGHLATIKLDTFVPFSWTELLIPGNGPYRALAVNLGIFAFYLLALVLASSWLRRRIPYRLWRSVHYVSFVVFALVTAHGFLAGSDAGEPWQRAIYAGALGGVGFLTLMRLFGGRSLPSTPRTAPREEESPA